MSRRSLVALGLALVAGGAFALTGCSNEESASSSSGTTTVAVEATKVDEIAAMLPQKIRDANKLVIGVNVPYAPNEFKDDSGQIVGFDVDVMTAVAQVFGVEPVFTEADFDKIIPAIQAGTFDMGMSSFTDTKAREETVDFTTYFSAGVQWAQRPDNPIDPTNACGKRVAVQATTVEDTEEVPAKSAACVAGRPAADRDRQVRPAGRRHHRAGARQRRRDVGGLTGDGVRHQAERRQDRGDRRGLRFRALRLARREGLRTRGRRCRRRCNISSTTAPTPRSPRTGGSSRA